LQAWHNELERREAKQDERDRKYRQHIETQLRRQAVELRALRRTFELVVNPLRRIEPHNPDLAYAQAMLWSRVPARSGGARRPGIAGGKSMKLLEDWRKVLLHSWAVWPSALSAPIQTGYVA